MYALRTLARRRVRTGLTVLGVAIGVAVVVSLTSLSRGIRAQFNALFAAGDAHLVLTRKGASDPFISYLPAGLLQGLRARPEVASAHPVLLAASQVPGQPLFFFYGTTEGSPFLGHLAIVEGVDPFDPAAGDAPLLLGRRGAEHLHLAPGDALRLGDREFRVCGLFESAVPLLDAGALLRYGDAQAVSGLEDRMTSALVTLRDPARESAAAAERALEEAFPEVEASLPAEFSRAFDEFDLMEQVATLLAGLALVVGGLGVMNTMLMSVFERTREIGILRAVGWSRSLVMREVLAEGFAVCALGAPAGVALGIGALEAVAAAGALSWISAEVSAGVVVEALAIGLGMGLLGAAYPSWRATRITPLEALRYE